MRRYSYDLRFRADQLQMLVSERGQPSVDLRCAYDPAVIAPIVGGYLPAEVVEALPVERRLELIDRICLHLSELPSIHPKWLADATPYRWGVQAI